MEEECLGIKLWPLTPEENEKLYKFIFKRAKEVVFYGINYELPFYLKNLDEVLEDLKDGHLEKLKKIHGEFCPLNNYEEIDEDTIETFKENFKDNIMVQYISGYNVKKKYYHINYYYIEQVNIYNPDEKMVKYFSYDFDYNNPEIDELSDCFVFIYDDHKVLADFDDEGMYIYLTKEEIEEFKKLNIYFNYTYNLYKDCE